MAQAYDFALNNMGMDFSSFTLWSDYILFLKNVDAAGSYAENQKISAIRKIYHRGIVIPMLNVESLWYAYIISFIINLFINTTVLCVCLFQKSKKRNSCLFFNFNLFIDLLGKSISRSKMQLIL